MRVSAIFAAGLGLLLGFSLSMPSDGGEDGGKAAVSIELAMPSALAQPYHNRGVARRTARRTSRRVVRRNTLPAGCAWRAPYHYCGGVYYQPVVESGRTVYIVVNP
ncbi:hypothetical protein [Afifella pfennigii]|uniref:hypothetical protein n=1 Tax=Afifella pfennigii TaxID=209897 RepID=UPI00047E55AA|nr:hypothetical protein [Afifella pfennigii]